MESRAEYFAHHLAADIEFAKAVKGPRTLVSYARDGNTAWLAARYIDGKGLVSRPRRYDSSGRRAHGSHQVGQRMANPRHPTGRRAESRKQFSFTAVSARLRSPSSAARTLLPPGQTRAARSRPRASADRRRSSRGATARRTASGYFETSSSPDDRLGDAVEVAADADVVDAGDLAHVLDVVGDLRQRRLRRRVRRSPCLRRAPMRRACRSAHGRRAAPRSSRAHGRRRVVEHRLRHERRSRTSPSPRRRSSAAARGSSRARCAARSTSARADECEKITGASVTSSASLIVAGDTCERSTSMPSRFISRTTSSPNGVRPPCFAGRARRRPSRASRCA